MNLSSARWTLHLCSISIIETIHLQSSYCMNFSSAKLISHELFICKPPVRFVAWSVHVHQFAQRSIQTCMFVSWSLHVCRSIIFAYQSLISKVYQQFSIKNYTDATTALFMITLQNNPHHTMIASNLISHMKKTNAVCIVTTKSKPNFGILQACCNTTIEIWTILDHIKAQQNKKISKSRRT